MTPSDVEWPATLDYASEHWATALLVAGDMGAPLRDLTDVVVAFEGRRLVGVAGAFRGFSDPSLTLSAETAEAADALVRRIAPAKGLLAASVDQPLPDWANRLPWSVDPWLIGDCVVEVAGEDRTEHVTDAAELAAFYAQRQAPYWCPAMLQSGGARVVRDRCGAIAAAVSVLFVLPDLRYAHLGGLVTAPAHQGQGLARSLVSAIRSSLARRGVERCGLFADAAHPWLVGFYERLGFRRVGAFRFADVATQSNAATS